MNIQTNANEIAMKYELRANAMRSLAAKNFGFATALHNLRKANLNKLIYIKTPYKGTKNAPKGTLMAGEKLSPDGTVYNTADHAATRANMKGTYKISPGMSKEADWQRISFIEILPVVRSQERAMNYKILTGT